MDPTRVAFKIAIYLKGGSDSRLEVAGTSLRRSDAVAVLDMLAVFLAQEPFPPELPTLADEPPTDPNDTEEEGQALADQPPAPAEGGADA